MRITPVSENKFSYDREIYDVRDNPVIFDIGSNIGQSSLWYQHSFPDAVIHSFEPFEVIYKRLEHNVSNRCHQFAFGEVESRVSVAPVTDAFYQQGSLKHGSGETIEVNTVDNFCARENISFIDIFKTDTEGYELQVLKGASRMLRENRIKYILAEATLVSTKHVNLFDLADFLEPFGFSLFSIFDVHHAVTNGGLKYCNALFKNLNGQRNHSALSLQ